MSDLAVAMAIIAFTQHNLMEERKRGTMNHTASHRTTLFINWVERIRGIPAAYDSPQGIYDVDNEKPLLHW